MDETQKSKITGYSNEAEIEHDEFHSSLEMDDTSGWRVFIVPGLAVLFLLGAIALLFMSGNDTTPDPRVQAQMRAKEEQKQADRDRAAAPPPAAAAAAPLPAEVPPPANGQ
jgi:hypothetical protein